MAVTRRQIWCGSAAAVLGAGLAGKLLAQGVHAFNPGPGTRDAISGLGDAPDDDSDHLQVSHPPKPMPAISFQNDAGKTLTLDAYRGHGVVLNFWATWCVPCIEELPSLDALSVYLQDRKIPVLPLASDRGGAETVRHFFATHGIRHLPVLLDPDMQAAHAIEARGVPTTLLIDAQGRECARLEGNADWQDSRLIARIKSLIDAT